MDSGPGEDFDFEFSVASFDGDKVFFIEDWGAVGKELTINGGLAEDICHPKIELFIN